MIYESLYGAAAIAPTRDVFGTVFTSEMRLSNKPALIDAATGNVVTYKQLLAAIDALSAALYGLLHFRKWDVVAIFSPNHIQFPIAVHAIVKSGGTVTLANPTYTVSELTHQLKDSGAKFLFTHPSVLRTALAAAQNVGIPESNIILFNEPRGAYPGPARRTVAQVSEENTTPAPDVKFTAEEICKRPAYLCYSSGTTGLPKGVETTQFNIVSNILQFEYYQKKTREVYSEDVFTGVLPMFHIFGLTLSIHICLQQGCTVIVFPKFELELYLKSLEKYRVTFSHVVPPILLLLANSPSVENYKFPKLRGFVSGAAPLAPEISEAIYKRLGVPVSQGYGLTETSPVTHLLPFSMARKHPTSAGRLFPNVQARLVDPDTGLDVTSGNKQGELWVRGPNIMKGYHNNPKATAEAIDKDGWFHTGDIATVSDDGLFFIVDRLKELIKYKGFQVPPAELEAHLLEHPAIADAAVIGRADKSAGEVPRAFVVLKPKVKCSEAEIIEFMDKKVAPHKRLRGGVAFVSEIPKSASGKILRRILRTQDSSAFKTDNSKAKL
ncbi:hypothetical protein HDU84_003326 [Entophlyctis sp. JEL0112]|nr:hypothetical protein HDU84_003326 [Entophlyctis sp. JEL0112]